MSKQQKFSELLGQRLTAAHQETVDDVCWQQLQRRLTKKRSKLTLWLSSAASLTVVGILSGIIYSGQIAPEPAAAATYQLEQLDAAIQQSIINNDNEQFERLIALRQQLNNPQQRTYTL